MTVRRVVLYTATTAAIAYILAAAVILHAANAVDHRDGWYDRSGPRCLP